MFLDNALILIGSEFRAGGVLIDGGRIAALAWADDERAALRARGDWLDAGGDLLLPGLVDAHCHSYATVLRGTENSLPLELWALWTMGYGRVLDAAAIHAATLLTAAEMIRGGITAVIDHFPHVRHAAAALAAHEQSGLRVGFAPFIQDVPDHRILGIDVPDDLRQAIEGQPPASAAAVEAQIQDITTAARAGSGRVIPMLGPNAPQRCSPERIALWRRLRDRLALPVHTHLLETAAQARACRAAWPGGLVGEMYRQGLLGPGLSCAHGIWLTPDERRLLTRHGVTVVHNPASNLMLGSGALPLAEYRALGTPLALGTDSSNTGGRHDLFEAMRLAIMLPRLAERDYRRWPGPEVAFEMATGGGARALGLAGQLGRIEPGWLADLVLLRRGPGLAAWTPDLAALVQHAGPEAVRSVMVDGRWLLQDGRMLAIDEAALAAEVNALRARLAEAAARETALAEAALPSFAAWYHAQPPLD